MRERGNHGGKIHYKFEFNEKLWEVSNSNAIGNGSFDVGLKLLLPIEGYEIVTLNATGKTNSDMIHFGTI